jgi:hypothetical protein
MARSRAANGASCILQSMPPSGVIIAQTLTDQDVGDPSQVAPLLDQIDDRIVGVTAVPSAEPGPPTQRDRHLSMITERGRLAWQAATDYGQRALIETTMGRYMALIGPRMRPRGFAAQKAEAAVGVVVLNLMLATGRPRSVRRQRAIA